MISTISKITFTCLLSALLFLAGSKPAEAALANTSQSPGTLSQGLVGHWTFDGGKMISNAADSSGNGNHGSLTNFGATSTAVAAGKIGQGLKFDGVNDYVKIGTYDIGGGTITTCAWVYITAATGNGAVIGDVAYFMSVTSTNGTINVTSNNNNYANSASSAITNNKWNHVCAVRLDSGTASLYANGVLSGTPNQTNTIVTSAFTTAIGTRGNAPAFYFKGNIDDVRLYSRALSASEITQLYNLGAAKVNTSQNPAGTISSGLVGWWTFDGKNLINNVVDSSGTGNTGYFRMGTTGNTATSSAVVAGKIGQGLKFDGISDQIITGSDFIGTSALTISAWVMPTGNPAGAPRVVDNTKMLFYWGPTSSTINFKSDGVTSAITSVNGSVPLNKWTYVSVTRDAAGLASLYVNGVLSGAANRANGTPTAGLSVAIGGVSGGATSNPFRGSMDDVRIYNRVLTAAEIKQLYNQSSAKVNTSQNPAGTLSSGLVGWWTFDGKNLIQNVADSSGLGNNGYREGTGATSSAVVSGKVGQALMFNGVDNTGVNALSPVTLDDLDTTGGLTVSAWIRPKSFTGQTVVVGKGGIGAAGGWTIFQDGGAGTIRFLKDYATTDLSNRWSFTSANYLNKWVHVVITWDGSDQYTNVNCYLDGIERADATPADGVGAKNSDAAQVLRMASGAGTSRFIGDMDDMRIYNRVLSAVEIKQIYNMGR